MKLLPEDLKNTWNVNRGEMEGCESLDVRNRRALAQKRLEEVPDLVRWTKAIQRAAASPYCSGSEPLGAEFHRGNFDWLLKPDTLIRIEEGAWDRRGFAEKEPPPAAEASPILSLNATNAARAKAGLPPRKLEQPADERFTAVLDEYGVERILCAKCKAQAPPTAPPYRIALSCCGNKLEGEPSEYLSAIEKAVQWGREHKHRGDIPFETGDMTYRQFRDQRDEAEP